MLMLDILIISLFCCGLHFITRDGWLLDFIDYALLGALGGAIRYGVDRSITWKNKLGEYAYKPLLGCVVCMGSVWGVLGSVYFGRIDQIPVICVCVSGLNGIIYFNLLEKHD